MSASVPTLQRGRVGVFHYSLRNSAGAVIDASTTEPMAYLHGYGGIISGLETALEGAVAGAVLDVTVAPADAYGELDEDASQSVHRSEFPKDMELAVGMPINAETEDGRRIRLWIRKIEGARVVVSPQHPLAGETLHFHIEVVEVREALPEELSHGHVHGPGGHHHH